MHGPGVMPDGSSGEVYRAAARFALVIAGGIIATKANITGWDEREVRECGLRLFGEWLGERGTHGSYDTNQGVKQVLKFIQLHGSSRFESLNLSDDPAFENQIVINRAGFKRPVQKGGVEYLILPEVFKDEMCKGYSDRNIAQELERLGYLKKGSESASLQTRVKLPGLGRIRVYVINMSLESDDDGWKPF